MRLELCARLALPFMAALAISAPVGAQRLAVTPSPGLWESTQKTMLNGVDVMAAMRAAQADMMKSLPPAERAQAEQMMKAQGMSMGDTQRECLTAQDVRELNDPALLVAQLNRQSEAEGDACRHEVVSVSGNTIQVRSQCKPQEGWQGTMQGTLTVHDARRMSHRFTGSGKLLGEAMPGLPNPKGPVNILVEGQTRWLAAACGEVKPGR